MLFTEAYKRTALSAFEYYATLGFCIQIGYFPIFMYLNWLEPFEKWENTNVCMFNFCWYNLLIALPSSLSFDLRQK